MRARINIIVFQFFKFFRRAGNKLRLFFKWITGRKVTRATVIADAKSIHGGAVVLYDYNEMVKFSFEFLLRSGIMKKSEVAKFATRGDRVLRKKWREQQNKDGKS